MQGMRCIKYDIIVFENLRFRWAGIFKKLLSRNPFRKAAKRRLRVDGRLKKSPFSKIRIRVTGPKRNLL